MKITPPSIALAMWLAVSVGIWLFGIVSWGTPYLPYPNVFTLLVIYGPWLVLLVVMVSSWGRRHAVGAAKPVAISLAAVIALSVSLYPYRDLAKERYFNAVLSSCQVRHGVDNMAWEDVVAFDGDVRRFRARNAADRRLIDCVSRRAGLLMTDLICPGESPWAEGGNALEVSFGTSHTLAAERFFSIARYDFAGPTKSPPAVREQCP